MVCSTVPAFDFVKDDCTIGSADFGKRGVNSVKGEYTVNGGTLSCRSNVKKFSELAESAAMGFSMVCVMLQAVYTTAEKECRTIVFLILYCSC